MSRLVGLSYNSGFDSYVDIAYLDERYSGLASEYLDALAEDEVVDLFGDGGLILPAVFVYALIHYGLARVYISEDSDDEMLFDMKYWDPIKHVFVQGMNMSDPGKQLLASLLLTVMETN